MIRTHFLTFWFSFGVLAFARALKLKPFPRYLPQQPRIRSLSKSIQTGEPQQNSENAKRYRYHSLAICNAQPEMSERCKFDLDRQFTYFSPPSSSAQFHSSRTWSSHFVIHSERKHIHSFISHFSINPPLTPRQFSHLDLSPPFYPITTQYLNLYENSR